MGGAADELSESKMEDACESATSPTRVFSARSFQRKNILHDGLWSDISDAEERAQAGGSRSPSPCPAKGTSRSTRDTESDYDETIGSVGVWCFLGGVAAVALLNYLFKDDEPVRYVYYYPQPPHPH